MNNHLCKKNSTALKSSKFHLKIILYGYRKKIKKSQFSHLPILLSNLNLTFDRAYVLISNFLKLYKLFLLFE